MFRLLAFLLAIAAVVLGVLGVIDVASGALTGSMADEVVGAALVIVPAVAYFTLRWYARRQGRDAFAATLEAGFAADHQGWYDGSGIAISRVRREILVASGGRQRIYPVADFTGLNAAFTPSPFGGIDHMTGMIMALVGIMQVIVGYFGDGLFISFADGSKWRIVGLRRRDADAWRQYLLDAGLLPA